MAEETAIAEEISEEITPEVDAIISKWKDEEGNLIMVFHAVQAHYGFIPRNVAMYVAKELDVPLARVYEIITFYNFFNLEPPAKYTVAVCTGTACHLKGAGAITDEFKKQLNISAQESYDADKTWKIEEVRCLGCCGLAPVVTVNGEVFGKVKPDGVANIIETTLTETK